MLQLNHSSNPLLMSRSSIVLPTLNQMLALTSVLEVFGTGQDAFFDVRVFYPKASSNHSMTTTAAYRKHELAKKREYAQRVHEVEHGVLHPSFSQQRVEWAAKLKHFIRDWWMEFPGRSEKIILWSLGGFVVVSPLQSSALPSYAFVEADPLATAQCMN